MRTPHLPTALAMALLLPAFAAVPAAAPAAAASTVTYKACAKKKTGAMRLIVKGKKCKKSEKKMSWNVQGPPGMAGPIGPAGPTGPAGPLNVHSAVNGNYVTVPLETYVPVVALGTDDWGGGKLTLTTRSRLVAQGTVTVMKSPVDWDKNARVYCAVEYVPDGGAPVSVAYVVMQTLPASSTTLYRSMATIPLSVSSAPVDPGTYDVRIVCETTNVAGTDPATVTTDNAYLNVMAVPA